VSALLIVVAAATAGVAPLDRWRQASARWVEIAVASNVCLPIVGVVLAARGASLGASPPSALPLLLLLLIGLAGLGRGAVLVARRRGFQVGGVVERGVGFLVLAAPIGFSGPLALAVVTLGAIARRQLSGSAGAALTDQTTPADTDAGGVARSTRRSSRRSLRPDTMIEAFITALSEAVENIEGRYDLAVGVLMLVVVLFVFAG
jgi:hypothetical protein